MALHMISILLFTSQPPCLPVFCLNLTRIFQHSHVDEEISRRLQAPRQVNVSPLPLVRGKQIAVLPYVIFLLRTQATRGRVRGCAAARSSVSNLLSRKLADICAFPYELLKLVRARAMVSQQAPLVPSHGQVVDEESARRGLIGSRVKGALEGLEQVVHILVEIFDLASRGTDELCLVWREVGEVLCPLGVLDLESREKWSIART